MPIITAMRSRVNSAFWIGPKFLIINCFILFYYNRQYGLLQCKDTKKISYEEKKSSLILMGDTDFVESVIQNSSHYEYENKHNDKKNNTQGV